MAIPKKIHYCWLSGEKMPKELRDSVNSWKKVMPDYEIVLWDTNKFDVNSVQWTAEACSVKKWAFAADYIRLYAVHAEGGIYLDTDVYAFKRMDDLLKYDFFTSFELKNPTKIFKDVVNNDLENICPVSNIHIEAAIFGGIQNHPFLKDCMNWYENHHYILPDGERNQKILAPHIYAAIAQKYGFRYIDEEQKLNNNMIIFPYGTKFFSPPNSYNHDVLNYSIEEFHSGIYAVHWHANAWGFTCNPIKKRILKLKQNNRIRKFFGKKQFLQPFLTLEDLIKKSKSFPQER